MGFACVKMLAMRCSSVHSYQFSSTAAAECSFHGSHHGLHRIKRRLISHVATLSHISNHHCHGTAGTTWCSLMQCMQALQLTRDWTARSPQAAALLCANSSNGSMQLSAPLTGKGQQGDEAALLAHGDVGVQPVAHNCCA
eukprot:GHRQ01037213.1.p1 GENE.GHRQ01037213.1~~GHRQ01037213.1.p1  ORF type:complete len:140 (-),score=13.26 GHRQ01037213.1:136-555(-)